MPDPYPDSLPFAANPAISRLDGDRPSTRL
jgi:hypothetical protein